MKIYFHVFNYLHSFTLQRIYDYIATLEHNLQSSILNEVTLMFQAFCESNLSELQVLHIIFWSKQVVCIKLNLKAVQILQRKSTFYNWHAIQLKNFAIFINICINVSNFYSTLKIGLVKIEIYKFS